eukprot:CAMPEP_0172304180 /NCGR_PEP_ID=MMETSP1058-20130122/5618_1 /TAXON_ID=83371 /ORGANISM="Detonula confervacea, Strain CCMP 353" /LENGTH=365 /DNA_ID=CAMNT_0013015299 /DNA_START=8 /DNA_END=1105 /DNA_ORIENTATION=+
MTTTNGLPTANDPTQHATLTGDPPLAQTFLIANATTIPAPSPMNLVELPDEIIHSIFSYVANSPSLIGPCICHILRPLSKQWQQEIDAKRGLWDLAIHDLSCDYYESNHNSGTESAQPNSVVASITDRPTKRARTGQISPPRRSSRLRPATSKERYIHHYNLLLSRNESALLELQERAHSSNKTLSLSILKRLVKEYYPIAINRRVRTGGTFLVEVVRARYVKETVILKCIKLLIGENGADPNVPSAEEGLDSTTKIAPVYETSAASGEVGTCLSSSTGRELYPLVIAAARGMATVVKYLLSVGANINLRGSSRFRLYSNPRKSVKGVDLTALEFAIKMRDNELENGVREEDLKGLNRVISLLEH